MVRARVTSEPPRIRLRTVAALMLASISHLSIVHATPKSDERARYVQPEETSPLRFTPINLANGSKLTLITPTRWSETASTLISVLNATHDHFTRLFSDIPAFSTSIRLMDEEEFFNLTGAPKWTNAMFFRGQIILPLAKSKTIDIENLNRSVRHEYTHAILSALSGGNLPGWIDEGLAQWFEGEESPGLRAALRDWLKTNQPVPLNLLQGGFTKLSPEMVPAAYAQSLLATRLVAERYGFPALAVYFMLLRDGIEKEAAFETAFGISLADFEGQLGRALKRWAVKGDG
ncbi:MAG: hypothetical protein RL518_388 [Pseudomonadota bacterium]